ncbi:PP2C family protein-serine/threonine phosphatase [Streptomyces sulphureus]|uniref:PP2C family protein-serine/threonine phosphatase n=1 Tax=Streptomyces sulphureus TaxID=47758 RepID=UPI000376CAC4|nr:PP2C family protein-serine/threonine phosphatase [Streptomyces sulphureus]
MTPSLPGSAGGTQATSGGPDRGERTADGRAPYTAEPPPQEQAGILEELGFAAARTAARARIRARRRAAEHGGRGHYAPEPGPPAGTTVALGEGAPDWARPVLSVATTPSAILRPDRGPDGEIVDFTLVAGNAVGTESWVRDPAALLDRPLSESNPGIRTGGLYDFYADVLAVGEPRSFENVDYLDTVDRRSVVVRVHGTASPYGGMLLVAWEAQRPSELSERVQRSSRMGWAEWDLLNGEVYASAGLRELLGLPDASERVPAEATELARLLDPRDLVDFSRQVRGLLQGEEVSESAVTVHVGGEERTLRWLGQPGGAQAGGPPESLLFTVRDITEQHREQQELRRVREAAHRLRQEAAAERKVSETLRRALTPRLPGTTAPGLSVAAGYLPWDRRVGGDWYKCRSLPDGRLLVAIGDASGHGVDAASRAVQQRAALAGLAYSEGDAAQLAAHLGEVVYHDGIDTTATAALGHLDPAERTFRWSSAGHPAPVLVRNGSAEPLDAPLGVLLGVDTLAGYAVDTVQLQAGDLLLLYTDGMVERRGEDPDVGVRYLLDAAASQQWSDAHAAVETLMGALVGPWTDDDATVLALHFR